MRLRICSLLCFLWASIGSASNAEICTHSGEQAERFGRAFQSIFERYVDYHDLLRPVSVSICQNRLSIYYTTPLGCTAKGLPGATSEHGVNFRIDVVSDYDRFAVGVNLGSDYFLYPSGPERRLSIDRHDRLCFQRQLRILGDKALFKNQNIDLSEAAPSNYCKLEFGDERAERIRTAVYPTLWKLFDLPNFLEVREVDFCGDAMLVHLEFPERCLENEFFRRVTVAPFGRGGIPKIYPNCPPLFSCTEIDQFARALSGGERACLLRYWGKKWQQESAKQK